MHQQPPKTPLFAATSLANASQLDSSRALIVYPRPHHQHQPSPPALKALDCASARECPSSVDRTAQLLRALPTRRRDRRRPSGVLEPAPSAAPAIDPINALSPRGTPSKSAKPNDSPALTSLGPVRTITGTSTAA